MERVIKFRGKTGTIWVEGYFIKDYEGTAYITTLDGVDTYVVDEKTVTQFTGLTDKNGKEIYEGDVVKIPDNYDTYGMNAGEIYEVYFHCGGFRLKPKYNSKAKGYWMEWDGELELLGNIYENPELLSTDKTKTI